MNTIINATTSKLASVLTLLFLLGGCGIQSIPQAENDLEAKWAEVQNQYKRRSDLVPNLVQTVKGYAAHEKETLQAVIDARAKATQTQINADQLDAQTLQKYQQAQGQLGQALGRLMVVAERYPELKANQNFLALQSQLEGTENRISIARRRYIESVQSYNNLITVFPTSLTNTIFFKKEKRPQFDISPQESATPQVQF